MSPAKSKKTFNEDVTGNKKSTPSTVDEFVAAVGLSPEDIEEVAKSNKKKESSKAKSDTSNYYGYGTTQYQYQQAFDINELRSAYPNLGQEKQSIEINLATGVSIVSRIKLIDGNYVQNSYEDKIDYEVVEDDINKFEHVGFRVYSVTNNNKILYLTRFTIL